MLVQFFFLYNIYVCVCLGKLGWVRIIIISWDLNILLLKMKSAGIVTDVADSNSQESCDDGACSSIEISSDEEDKDEMLDSPASTKR